MLSLLEGIFLDRIAIALLVGALLGFEREYAKKKIVGLRTFSLTSLAGALLVMLSASMLGDYLLVVLGFCFISAIGAIYYYFGAMHEKESGFTTSMALIISYLLGVLVGFSYFTEAIFLSITVAIILFSKQKLHDLVDRLTEKEMADILEFLVVLGIIYPLIPAQTTLLGVNIPLMTMWILVVTISVINFIAFVSSKYLSSKREVEALSFLGGLISSSATLIELTQICKKEKKLFNVLGGGFLILSAASIIRNFIIVALTAPAIIALLGIPVLMAAGITLLLGFKKIEVKGSYPKLQIGSPFNVAQGVKLAVAIFVLYFALNFIGTSGYSQFIFLFAFIGGFVETSAMMISLTSMFVEGTIGAPVLALSVLIAQAGGYLANIMLFYALGGKHVIKENVNQLLIGIIIAFVALGALIIF